MKPPICRECGTDHDDHPPGSVGAALTCLRAQAERAGLIGFVDQADALVRYMREATAAHIAAIYQEDQ